MTFIGPYGKFEMILGWMIFAAICMRNSGRKALFPLRAVLSMMVCLFMTMVFDAFDTSIVFYYLLLIIFFVCLRLCFRNTIWQALLVTGIAYAMQFIMYSVWLILSTYLIPGFAFLEYNFWAYCFYFIVLAIMIAAAWGVTRGFKRFAELEEFNPPVVVIFLVIIFVAGFLCNQINNFENWDTIILARVLSAIVCALGIWIAIDILVNQKIKMESAMQQYMIERQKEEFELRKETINDLNIKCHDLKYQIREIYNRIGKNDTSGLEEIEDRIMAFQSSYQTGNEALNVVLSEKARMSSEKGISFNFMGNGELISFMSDMDIYRLFNNAIDNAIEASEKIEKEKRIIGVIIGFAGPFISVRFENYYNGQLELSNDMPLTSKENKQNHGFGVKSIKSIADNYGAQFAIEHDDEVFALTLLFPTL